jgi:2-keto-4-pentenoate hydratase/2-oxohepta-3-ene-1,7-dioic acid hydratase in catechol pathway
VITEATVSYRLLSYQSGRETRAGILVEEQVYDPAAIIGNPAYNSVLAILQDWRNARSGLALAAERIIAGKSRAKGVPVKRVKLVAPVLYPGNIYCAGANYTDHMAEMARAHGREPGPTMKERGEKPWHFIKASRSTVAGPGAKVKIPPYCRKMDWEVELAAVIGRTAKDVPVDKALDVVAGYTIADDLSARDAGRREKNPETSPFYMDWLSHKSFDGSCPLGPWITPAGDIPDPQQLGIRLWVNGELMQDSHTSKMIFTTAEQIAMLSSRVTLNPGDLVLTGTPAGVGMGRQRFLSAGDSVKLWIEGIGELTHTMA